MGKLIKVGYYKSEGYRHCDGYATYWKIKRNDPSNILTKYDKTYIDRLMDIDEVIVVGVDKFKDENHIRCYILISDDSAYEKINDIYMDLIMKSDKYKKYRGWDVIDMIFPLKSDSFYGVMDDFDSMMKYVIFTIDEEYHLID